MKAIIIATDGFEDTELLYPYYRLQEEKIDVKIATPGKEEIEGKHGYTVDADLRIDTADTADYDLLVLPGGKSPESLRMESDESIEFVREFDALGKPIAAICHGAQLLISADAAEGMTATCYWSIMDDLEAAGATVRDQPVVVDSNLVTSRCPEDLPEFMEATLEKMEEHFE